jgi:NADH-quinone oxidoreductase subunit N
MIHSIPQILRAFLQGSGATILPELELLLFALGIFLIDRWLEAKEKHWNAALALSGTAFSGYTLWTLRAQVAAKDSLFGFRDSILIDPFFLLFASLLLAAVALVILFSGRALKQRPEVSGPYHAWIMIAAAGMLLMVSGSDLVTLFLGLAITTLSFYFLSGISLRGRSSEVAPLQSVARRYILIWLLGPAFAASGFALLYQLTSSSNIGRISIVLGQRSDLARALALSQQPGSQGESMRQLLEARMPAALQHHLLPLEALPLLALLLILSGLFLCCVAAASSPVILAPAPNATVEENASVAADAAVSALPSSAGILPASSPLSPHLAFTSIAASTAIFATLLRLLLTVFSSSQETWSYLLAGLSLLGLASASLLAFRKITLANFLPICCLSQFAFLLLGLVSANETAIVGVAFHLLVYVFMAAGAFTIALLLAQNPPPPEPSSDPATLYQRNPTAAYLLTLFLFSLAGIPPTGGFLAKYYIFKSLIETRHFAIAIVAGLFLLPMLYFCIRIALTAFRKPPAETGLPPITLTNSEAIALGICLFVTLAAGLYPEPFQRLARYAFGQ